MDRSTIMGPPSSAEPTRSTTATTTTLPTETELALLCLDHLRALRRGPRVVRERVVREDDYLTMACWALQRALGGDSTDAFAASSCIATTNSSTHTPQQQQHVEHDGSVIPTILEMERELLPEDEDGTEEKKSGSIAPDNDEEGTAFSVLYDDTHPSNHCRFYLAGGVAPTLPLTLGELTATGLVACNARSRRAAERELVHHHPLYEAFCQAVQAKGFFAHDIDDSAYEERYSKVVAKFRQKLALSMTPEECQRPLVADLFVEQRLSVEPPAAEAFCVAGLPVPSLYALTPGQTVQLGPEVTSSTTPSHSTPLRLDSFDVSSMVQSPTHHHQESPADVEKAESYKIAGNNHMQRKEYAPAADCYTKALSCSPAGPQSHVYYSNRAAALVSMKAFDAAITDSERALALQPTYGKAHARLGLAHFLLGQYRPAVEAYTVALQYEPANPSSQNYLAKAAQRLAAQQDSQQQQQQQQLSSSSYSVVSEWSKGKDTGSHHQHPNSSSNSMINMSSSSITGPLLPPTASSSSHSEDQPTAEQQQQQQPISTMLTADQYKSQANAHMAARQFEQAHDAYTQAIQLASSNNNTTSSSSHLHVYYSNRAAALCYLERYSEAERDSLAAIRLEPMYGKAHARLGLCRFLTHQYPLAIAAYATALEYDPHNAAAQAYLAKAQQAMLRQQEEEEQIQQREPGM